jgi:phage tail sheath protein FI
VLGVRVVYDQGDRDLLQANQVNYIRKFPGQGYAIMEANTLQTKQSALSFVPVRRMLIVIETAMENALLYSLWEPADPATEARIVGMLNDYLFSLKQNGSIQDYNVVSNTNNNTVNDLNQGILHVDVYILPTLPVQRIRLRTIITKQGLSFQEAALLAA